MRHFFLSSGFQYTDFSWICDFSWVLPLMSTSTKDSWRRQSLKMGEPSETNWAELPTICIQKIVRYAADGHFNNETLGLLSDLDQKELDHATKLQRVWATEWTRHVCNYGKRACNFDIFCPRKLFVALKKASDFAETGPKRSARRNFWLDSVW